MDRVSQTGSAHFYETVVSLSSSPALAGTGVLNCVRIDLTDDRIPKERSYCYVGQGWSLHRIT